MFFLRGVETAFFSLPKTSEIEIFNEFMEKIKNTMMGQRRNDFWELVKTGKYIVYILLLKKYSYLLGIVSKLSHSFYTNSYEFNRTCDYDVKRFYTIYFV